MTLPISPNTLYTPGATVLAVDLNDMQAGIAGGLHGYVSERISLDRATPIVGAPEYVSGLAWQLAGGESIRVPLDSMRQGCRLRSLRLRCRDHADAAVTLSLRQDTDGAIVTWQTEITGRTGTVQWLTIDLAEDEYTPPTESARVFADITAVGSGTAVCVARIVELVMARVVS